MASRFSRVWGRRRRLWAADFRLFSHRFMGTVRVVVRICEVLTVAAALMALVSMFLYVGFDHRPEDIRVLMRLIRIAWFVFIANALLHFLGIPGQTRSNKCLTWILNILLFLTAVPLLWRMPAHPLWGVFTSIIYSKIYIFSVLGAYAVFVLSYAISQIPDKRTSPALMLSSSFLLIIVVGTLLLMLPKSTTAAGISLVDAFFCSTSAVCITGLTPVDVSATFTPMGLIILAVLIELGGLGVLTFTSFFALFFSGNSSIYNQLVLRDAISSPNMSRLLPTMLYILGFTLVIQLAGAVGIYLTVPEALQMDVGDKVFFSVFTSLSAFCNAGFSNLPQGFSNPALMQTAGQGIYWVTSLIVLAGAIGFPMLVNIRDAIVSRLRPRSERPVHIFNMNSRIVFVTTTILFVAGATGFFFLEYDNTLRGMTLWQKVSQAVFNSTTPRSSGFMSVNPGMFMDVTLVMVMFLMWIGGAAQSTAGGVKVNSFAAVALNLRAIVKGRHDVTAFNRTIGRGSIARANAVVVISIFAVVVYVIVMLLIEPGLPTRSVVFEVVSALFTVGSSLGITADLSVAGKIVLSTAMFLGRVGIISLLGAMSRRSEHGVVRYPTGNIIIN